ncbi:alkaline phosphatase PafA [Chitinophaga silvatica]|nr:alkaline phosphatase PafA [Chitinophaga silvatica]
MRQTVVAGLLGAFAALQGLNATAQVNEKPKLIVGIVVDQMRWDYLYRYYDRYEAGGFKRMLGEGFSCENTYISHLPSFTAVGHSTIYTGSIPAIHGITGNDWPDQITGRKWYCTEDTIVQPVGTTGSEGRMSPRNLLATTITDELRLATNFRSKVVGVSLKDRASILPAGHNPNGAFWYDDSNSNFVTSSWYMNELPDWVKKFNNKKEPAKLMSRSWETMYPIKSYKLNSTEDDVAWEGTSKGEKAPVFPHELKEVFKNEPGIIRSTPFGNTLTLSFANAAVEGYDLGKGEATDFLTINCASTDYVGHKYGPNSIEVEDTYLRLDKDLSAFFSYLDQRVGKGNYLVFLTADHGAAHSIKFLQEHQIPAGLVERNKLIPALDSTLNARFGVSKLVSSFMNYHVSFDKEKIKAAKLDYNAVKAETVEFFQSQPGIQFAADLDNIGNSPLPEPIKSMAVNGYNPKRTGAVIVIPEPGWFEGSLKGTTHGNWNPFDIHIPLVFMGWHVKHGATNETVHMTDIAATLAAMLHIQMPSGCVGKPVKEVLQ